MPLSIEDKAYLWDILDACNDIIVFLDGKSLVDFGNEKMARFAVERQLVVIGEASKKLSDQTRLEYKDIPWKRMIGFRNILAHEYGEILVERIWKIGTGNIPMLKTQIDTILKENE